MKTTTIAIAGLTVALIASNVWWAYGSLDMSIRAHYAGMHSVRASAAAAQAIAILPVASRVGATRADILAAAGVDASAAETIDRDGYTMVGRLGLKFDANGRIVAAVTYP